MAAISVTQFRLVNCHRIEHDFLPLAIYSWYRRGVLDLYLFKNWMLTFFCFVEIWLKKPTCTLFIKMWTCTFFFFLFIPQRNAKKQKQQQQKKKKPGNFYNLIANHFHVKIASKFKFIRKCKKRLFLSFSFFFFFLNECLFDLPRSEKQNEELFIFERGDFWSCPGRNSRVVKAEKLGGFRAAHTRTVLIWEYPPPPPSLPRVLKFVISD